MTNRYARPDNFGHPIRNPLLRKHFVYRAFAADGHLLYVGCSHVPEARLAAHRSQSHWYHEATTLKVAGPYNYETARELEHDAIDGERPQFNYTREKRNLDLIRRRMIDREIQAAVAAGGDFMDSIAGSVEAVDALLPSAKHERITDLMVPNARRIEREHLQALAERGAA